MGGLGEHERGLTMTDSERLLEKLIELTASEHLTWYLWKEATVPTYRCVLVSRIDAYTYIDINNMGLVTLLVKMDDKLGLFANTSAITLGTSRHLLDMVDVQVTKVQRAYDNVLIKQVLAELE